MEKKYRRILQPADSYEDIPCYDCCFVDKETGECNAPEDVINDNLDCGYTFHGNAYVYEYT